MNFSKTILLYTVMAICSVRGYAQDTVIISIEQAEKQFLENNLQLLAEHCNIDVSKACLIQARVFNNPKLSASINMTNLENRQWFDANRKTGHYGFALEQIFRIGGSRSRGISLAKAELLLSENKFADLLRTLRFLLNSTFYEAYYARRSLNSFDTQIALLEGLQMSYKGLKDKGVVSLGEQARIQSLLYGLRSDKLDLQETFNGLQSQLQLLLQDNMTVFIPDVSEDDFAFRNPDSFALADLIDGAVESRIDLQMARNELTYRKRKVSMEKAVAIPDFTLAVNFDKHSYVANLFTLNASILLPVFNLNRGNIRAAKATVARQELLVTQKQTEVENEVRKAYANALEADRTNRSIDTDFEHNLQLLLQSITDNFRKKNISMLQFTDFYEAYRDNTIKINQIKNRKAQSMEELRFAVGTDF